MVGYATAQRRARIALDVGEEAVRFANPLLPETRSEIALPLRVGDQVLGALDVQSTQEAAFDEASAALLQSMADQVAIALNNAAQFTDSRLNVEALNRLLALSTDLARSRSLHDLTDRALEHFEALLGTSNYYMALVDGQQTEVRFVLRRRSGAQPGDEITMRPFGNGRAEYVIRTRQPLRLSLAEAPTRLEQLGVKPWEKQSAAFLGVPILAGDRVLGMIGLQDFSPNASFSDYQERVAVALASQIAVTLENLRLVEETQRAFADLDAANRLLTGRAWERYARRARMLSGEWHAGEWLTGDGSKGKVEELHTPHALRIPVRVRGQTIGEFDILPTDLQREWTPDDVAFAQSLIDQVGQAIETARLLEETERLAGRERTINQINSRVRQMVNVDSILQAAVNELGRSLKATRVFARIGSAHEAQPAGPKPSGTRLLTLPDGLPGGDDTPPAERGDDHV
jgi:GAF domain-containing protein